MLQQLALNAVAIAFATWITWRASDRLEEAAHQLALIYRLPEIVKGSIVMAVSSSFPELATIVLAGSVHGEFELGLATIIGSAIFNVLVIPAASVFFRPGKLGTDPSMVFREAQFYLVSVLIICLTLALAVIFNPVGEARLEGEMGSALALLPLSFYLVYLYIQYHEVRDHHEPTPPPRARPYGEWLWLIASMLLVTLGVEILIRSAISLGELFNTPSYFWGITVIAAATSLPDLFLSVKAAQRPVGISSLSNVIGSNVFDLLVALPIGVLAVGVVVVDLSRALPMLGFLTIATVVLLVFMRRDFRLSTRESIVLMILYVAFLAWVGLESFTGLNVLGTMTDPQPGVPF